MTFDSTSVGTTSCCSEYGNELRIILIGDSGVGKSSLFRRFFNEKLTSIPDVTVGYDCFPFVMEVEGGNHVKVVVFDTAGQELYRSLTRSYYRRADGVMLVYDISNRRSFESLKGWYDEACKLVESDIGVYLLVGNQADKKDQRQVQYKEGLHFAQMKNCKFVETSAITGLNVDDSFITVAKDIYNTRLQVYNNRSVSFRLGPRQPTPLKRLWRKICH